MSITPERVRELLHYDPEEGVLRWRAEQRTGNGKNLVNAAAGDIAGGFMGNGYWYISLDGCRYLASRLAWLYMTGEWPPSEIDHRDGDEGNNRWLNLRASTRSQNGANTRRRSDNTSGFKGVTYDKSRKKWQSKIRVNGRDFFLGRFDDPELAHAAYVVAAEKHFGEFARAA